MATTVAVVGASSDRQKFGNKALRAFRDRGYVVVPINPRESEVEGEKSYASVLDVPGQIDMATFYVGPSVGLKILEDVAKKGIPEVWLNPGADSPQVVDARPGPRAQDRGRLFESSGSGPVLRRTRRRSRESRS